MHLTLKIEKAVIFKTEHSNQNLVAALHFFQQNLQNKISHPHILVIFFWCEKILFSVL